MNMYDLSKEPTALSPCQATQVHILWDAGCAADSKHIRSLTEILDSKLADVGEPL